MARNSYPSLQPTAAMELAMNTNRQRWRGVFLLLLPFVSGLTPTSHAAETSLYHHDLDGEEIDLQQWHYEHRDRCLALDNPGKLNSKITDIIRILDYLGREKTYAQYLLSRARQAGILICVDNRADGTRGYYDYNNNIIVVREGLSFMEKVAIVVHELRHVDHVLRGYRQTLDYAMEEEVRLIFAVEADVQAFSALVAWRLKQAGDGSLWKTLLSFERYSDIAQVFEDEIRTGSDEHQAARAAFVQWYRSSWRQKNYYRGCCMGYLDMLDETNRIEQYTKLPENYFDQLCLLPDGSNYGCHKTEDIRLHY